MNKTFGKEKLIKDLSANTLQTAINQIFSLVIFYFTSRYLAKSDFGEFNWTMAFGSIVIVLSSLGLDVVLVKKVASGQNILVMSGIHFFHTVVIGIVLCLLVFILQMILPDLNTKHPLFLLVFINLSLINISNSFRLCLMGLESYKKLAILALIVNPFRFIVIVLLYLGGYFTIYYVLLAFIVSSALEFLLGYYLTSGSLNAKLKPVLKVVEYKYFIIESLPQLGVVFFDSALARIDWIMIGIMGTAAMTAEYSFVFRIYESSKLPLLVIAPILLTRFSKLFFETNKIDDKSVADIHSFFKLELFVVMLIPLLLICSWTPLVDYFTDNKYGSVNELNYIVLAACVPLHCIINFLWSMGFAQGQLRVIMYITISVAGLNFILNYFLIPIYGSAGASVAFLISTLFQTILYGKYMKQEHLKLNIKACAIVFVNAFLAVLIAKFLTNNVIFATSVVLVVFTAMAIFTGLLSINQLRRLIKS